MVRVVESGDLPVTETVVEGPNGSKVRIVDGGRWTSVNEVPDADLGQISPSGRKTPAERIAAKDNGFGGRC